MKTPRVLSTGLAIGLLVTIVGFARLDGGGVQPAATVVDPTAVDEIFARFDGTRIPGCAVGIAVDGQPVLERAYGMADLEHGVPNTPETVFEPGSVAKQFTAAATVLLALDGKLSLDDDVRQFVPEVPDHGHRITIRHLLNHTSGLRDWGSIAGIGGWPRTTRAHTHDHVLDIVARQRALNYPPGEHYSYTNTGYNLQAILVERVSGLSFAEFTRRRLFEPLGMTRTQWRDDFTRIVENRAVAYRPGPDGGVRMNMPFENVHGNGGLLTTVGDLLRWTDNLQTGELGGPDFLEEMHRPGVLNSGRTLAYASGLVVGSHRGVRAVEHSGSTAGYRGFLTRFPDHGVAVAVMCNTSGSNPTTLAHQTAELYLGDLLTPATEATAGAAVVRPSLLTRLSGRYRDDRTGALVRIEAIDGALRIGNDTLAPSSQTRFVAQDGTTLQFEAADSGEGRRPAMLSQPRGNLVRLEPVPDFAPTAAALSEYAGAFRSEEAEVTYTIELTNGSLTVRDRYGNGGAIEPAYPDAFTGDGRTYIFHRDATSGIGEMSLSESRVWDLRFRRVP